MKKAALLLGYIFQLVLSQTLTTYLQENFESGTLPVGWRSLHSATANGWVFGTNDALSSGSFNIPNVTGIIAVSNDDGCGPGCDGNADYLDTPAMTVSTAQGLFLKFKSYFTGQYNHRATVLISTNGLNGPYEYVYALLPSNPSTAVWQTVALDLSSFITSLPSNVAIRFWSSDDSGWAGGWAIDDVLLGSYNFVGVVPNCTFNVYPPPGTHTDNLAQTLSWGNTHDHFGFPYGYYLSFGTDNPPTNVLNRVDMGLSTSWQTQALQANLIYYWQVTPYGELAAGFPTCEVWSFTTDQPPWIGAKTIPYQEDFENGIGGWFPFSTGSSSWTFGPLQHAIIRDDSGLFCWSTGNGGSNSYNPNEYSFLISPPFDFSNVVGELFINFKFWWNTEDRYDGAIFQYSRDTLHPLLMNWTTIGNYSDGWPNWYDTEYVSSLPPPNHGWCGSGPDKWAHVVHPLPGLAGLPLVYFRVLFTSDGSIQYDGVAIDDINIGLRPVTAPLCSIPVFPPNGITGVGLSTNLEWTKNPNDSPFLPVGYYLYVGTTEQANDIIFQMDVFAETSYTIHDLQPSTRYYWKVIPYGVNRIVPPATSCPLWSFTATHPRVTIPYFEDFENGLGGWAPLGKDSTWSLGTPNKTVINGAASPTNSWVTGTLTADYINYENSYVLSPLFDYSNYTIDPLFTAKVWWELENNWDGVNLQINFEEYNNWTTVGTVGDGQNWFTSSTLNYQVGESNTGWTGRNGQGSNGWVTASRILDGAAGKRFKLRFAFASDGSVTSDGFAFDDVHIKFPEDLIPSCPALVYPPNNAINLHAPLNLQWTPDYTIPGLPAGSTVVYGTTNPPTTRINVKVATSYPIITDLPYNTVIYWKVEPYGLLNNTENRNCSVWSFTTSPTPATNPSTWVTNPTSPSSVPSSSALPTSAPTSNAVNPPVESSSGSGSSVNIAAAVAIPVIIVVAIAAVVGIIFLVRYMKKRQTLHKKLQEISTELGRKE